MPDKIENVNESAALSGITSTTLFGIWVDADKQKPEVGKKVIVCGHYSNGNRWQTIATWQPAGTIDAEMWDDTPDDWWDEDGNVCTNPHDVWFEQSVELETTGFLENVTHWMPLPDMPNDQEEQSLPGTRSATKKVSE
jgi:hypothetical protein